MPRRHLPAVTYASAGRWRRPSACEPPPCPPARPHEREKGRWLIVAYRGGEPWSVVSHHADADAAERARLWWLERWLDVGELRVELDTGGRGQGRRRG